MFTQAIDSRVIFDLYRCGPTRVGANHAGLVINFFAWDVLSNDWCVRRGWFCVTCARRSHTPLCARVTHTSLPLESEIRVSIRPSDFFTRIFLCFAIALYASLDSTRLHSTVIYWICFTVLDTFYSSDTLS